MQTSKAVPGFAALNPGYSYRFLPLHASCCLVHLRYRSMHMAMPMPPPMQSVARPFLALRFCIS
jgi:hypothetical protein